MKDLRDEDISKVKMSFISQNAKQQISEILLPQDPGYEKQSDETANYNEKEN